jgi:outer membrane receptor protein involved in Fe transport
VGLRLGCGSEPAGQGVRRRRAVLHRLRCQLSFALVVQPTPSIYTWVNGYSIQNFRGGFRTESLDAFLWVRNAFDRNYIDLLLAGTGGNTGLIAAQVGDPRTFGGTIRLKF